jgi:hypothetical protein
MDRRWRWWLSFLPVLFLVTACSDTAVKQVPATFAEAQALAAKTGRPLLLDFYTSW